MRSASKAGARTSRDMDRQRQLGNSTRGRQRRGGVASPLGAMPGLVPECGQRGLVHEPAEAEHAPSSARSPGVSCPRAPKGIQRATGAPPPGAAHGVVERRGDGSPEEGLDRRKPNGSGFERTDGCSCLRSVAEVCEDASSSGPRGAPKGSSRGREVARASRSPVTGKAQLDRAKGCWARTRKPNRQARTSPEPSQDGAPSRPKAFWIRRRTVSNRSFRRRVLARRVNCYA